MNISEDAANQDIRALKEVYDLSWKEIIKAAGMTEGYFYKLLKTEMSPEYRGIVLEAIHKAAENKEQNKEKCFKNKLSRLKKVLDFETSQKMYDSLIDILNTYDNNENKERFDIRGKE